MAWSSSNGLDPQNWLAGCLPPSGSRVEVDASASYPLPITQNSTFSVLRFEGAGKSVVIGDYDLTVEDSIIGADSLNYVQTVGGGKLCMSVNAGSLRKFPVGRKAYNPVEITNNTGISDNFCIRVLDEVYSGGTTGNVLSSDPRIMRTWDIDKGNGTANAGSGVDFKFWWNTSEDTLNPVTFYLSHYDGIVWNQLPGTVSLNGRCLSYTGYMGSFSPFAINGDQPLPVSWLYVKGECKGRNALIEWATATELNNSHFEIEGSEDGRVWHHAARVEAAGNSAEVKRYSQEVSANHPYFRVVQEDFDLSRTYSEVIYLPCSAETPASILIYPNPSGGVFHVLGVEKVRRYRLVNAIGITLRMEDHDGSEQFSLDLQQLERGLYYLRLEDGTTEQVHRLVLQ